MRRCSIDSACRIRLRMPMRIPTGKIAALDPTHPYSLAELVDIAEHNNPRTRIVWERAKQKAEQLGIAKSAYFPVLTGIATFADERIIEPFPQPLHHAATSWSKPPVVQPEIALQYLVFDFGKREANIGAARPRRWPREPLLSRRTRKSPSKSQGDYYKLVTATGASSSGYRKLLKTAQTMQDAAEDRLQNGRATMPACSQCQGRNIAGCLRSGSGGRG